MIQKSSNRLRSLYLLLIAAMGMSMPLHGQDFARGADVSWCSEMEAAGKKFYNTSGQQRELMQLMAETGMNAIRLRVWVDPSGFGYGAWSDKADVLAKARRVKEAGLDVMIDFHYSDFFADPSTQTKPAAWANLNMTQLKKAVADHTTEVLQALKDEGIEPRWVQVGNETTSGMLWDSGKLWTSAADKGWSNYVALSNAGYQAAKAVFPNVKVIVHHDKGADDPTWFYTDFKRYGGKFDMIGLSHYPETDWENDNTRLAAAIQKMHTTHRVPVMVVETGYNAADATLAEEVMTDLFAKVQAVSGCAGIFYWEPEVYGNWKPAYYTNLSWPAYKKGAFTAFGRPGKALNPFKASADGITDPKAFTTAPTPHSEARGNRLYDLSGRAVSLSDNTVRHPVKGIYLLQGKKVAF